MLSNNNKLDISTQKQIRQLFPHWEIANDLIHTNSIGVVNFAISLKVSSLISESNLKSGDQTEANIELFCDTMSTLDSLLDMKDYSINISEYKWEVSNNKETRVVWNYLVNLFEKYFQGEKINNKKAQKNEPFYEIAISDYIISFYWEFNWPTQKEINLKKRFFDKEVMPSITNSFLNLHIELYNLYKTNYDCLTNLRRSWFIKDKTNLVLEEAKQKKSTIAFFYIDLDNFKRINDHFCHETWDLMLIETANVLLKIENKNGWYSWRKWWEELCFVIWGKTEEEIIKIWNDIQSEIKKICLYSKDKKIKQTASIWIWFYDFKKGNSLKTVSKLIAFSDDRMYEAKELWRDFLVLWEFRESDIDDCINTQVKTTMDVLDNKAYLVQKEKRKNEIIDIIREKIDIMKDEIPLLSSFWIFPENNEEVNEDEIPYLSSLWIYHEDEEIILEILTWVINNSIKVNNRDLIIKAIRKHLHLSEKWEFTDRMIIK